MGTEAALLRLTLTVCTALRSIACCGLGIFCLFYLTEASGCENVFVINTETPLYLQVIPREGLHISHLGWFSGHPRGGPGVRNARPGLVVDPGAEHLALYRLLLLMVSLGGIYNFTCPWRGEGGRSLQTAHLAAGLNLREVKPVMQLSGAGPHGAWRRVGRSPAGRRKIKQRHGLRAFLGRGEHLRCRP